MSQTIGIEAIRDIANAVLYEGYLLYPYRRSAIKNRRRWTFGVVYPQAYTATHGETEPCTMRTECLVIGGPETTVDVTVRFLHLLRRSTRRTAHPLAPQGEAARVGAESWEEGIEREVTLPTLALGGRTPYVPAAVTPYRAAIDFPAGEIVEPAEDAPKLEIVREQAPLIGEIDVAAGRLVMERDEGAKASAGEGGGVFKLSVQIANTTPLADAAAYPHDAVLPHAFVSTHTVLQVRAGAFVSLLDPPDALASAARDCQNQRTYPVLVGAEGTHDALLSSPIILYDYPQIAAESPGALFDGTEIDELLSLRILTLSDDEKAELRQGDDRARDILERTEALTPEQLMKMHGVIRGLRPASAGEGSDS